MQDSTVTGPKPLSFETGKGELCLSLLAGFDHITDLDVHAHYVFVNVLQGHLDRLFSKPLCHPCHVLSRPEGVNYRTRLVHIEASAWIEAEVDGAFAEPVASMLNFALWQALNATLVLLTSEEVIAGKLPSQDQLSTFVDWAVDAYVHTYDLQIASVNTNR